VNRDADSEAGGLDRRLDRLATERSAIFARGGKDRGLSEAERGRIRAIEKELDECFALRRQRWAARDAHRFSRQREGAVPSRPRDDGRR
jgi:hypothetical protein